MAGEIQLNGTSFATESSGTITVNNGTLGSSIVFPAGHILQTVSNFQSSSVTAGSNTASTSASNSHSGYILVVSVGITFVSQNPNILVYADSGEIDKCDSRMNCRIFYNSSTITDANINSSELFETTYGTNQSLVCLEIGRGINNGSETHRPGVSYQQIVPISASAGDTYYFALGIGRQLDSASARVGNGAHPQIVVSEIKS